jgi:cellulose biosynthesis protein BcsQ
MPTVVSVVQRKGGVGKTTLAASLAAAAVSARVTTVQRSKGKPPAAPGGDPVLVDVDSQGSATTWALGALASDTIARCSSVAMLAYPPAVDYLPPGHRLRSVRSPEELLDAVLPECLLDSVVPGLRVIGSTPRVHPEDTEHLLLRELPAGVIIVDTGPDCSTPIVRSVLAQSDAVIVPVAAEPWSVDMVREVWEELQSVGRADLIHDRRIRVVISRRQRTKVQDVLEQSIRDSLGDLVSKTVIPHAAAIALVSHRAENLTARNPLRKLAEDLLREVLSLTSNKAAAA